MNKDIEAFNMSEHMG